MHLLAQALFHFLWQGILLWAGALCLLPTVKGRGPQARYAIYLVLFMLLAACPVATLMVIASNADDRGSAPLARESYGVMSQADETTSGISADAGRTSRSHSPLAKIAAWGDGYHSQIVVLWLAGVRAGRARLAVGGIGLYMIVRVRQPLPPRVARRRRSAGSAPGVSRAACGGRRRAAFTGHGGGSLPADGAAAGLVGPGLQPDVLDAVVAHELAHLRRWDLPLNVMQRAVEVALFFHPVVWWCSRQLRIEREMCCDELALRAIDNRAQYAKALTFLASRQVSPSATLLGAGIGGSRMVLRERIRNVLGLTSLAQSQFYGPSCALPAPPRHRLFGSRSSAAAAALLRRRLPIFRSPKQSRRGIGAAEPPLYPSRIHPQPVGGTSNLTSGTESISGRTRITK